MAKRLMDEAREIFRALHYSYRTEVTYTKWIKRFIKYHGNAHRAKRPIRMPIVMTRVEVVKVLACIRGRHWLMASLLYGSGLRTSECLQLRVQSIDIQYLQLTVRDGKGSKDRRTILPDTLVPHIEHQLEWVKGVLKRDINAGRPGVSLPSAVNRKYRNASLTWKWQYLFPSAKYALIRENMGQRRHRAHPSGLSRAVKNAV